ncbi:MAG: sulfatase-like hydrolase/transferase, partial [Anaerolineae bacterium]|nr:sulfatase-like hydrolase/transferase [Anaerolineae bacterium]
MPKNVVLITTDQHRWDYLGAMGQPILEGLTPNLDRLAEGGALFEHCYSPNPLCMPARHAMQSGLYTFQSGQMNNVGDWPLDFPTFPQVLRRHGYRTALTGKLHAHEAVGYDIDLTDQVWDDEIHALGFDDVVQTAGKSMAFFTEDAYTHHLADHNLLYAYREDIL